MSPCAECSSQSIMFCDRCNADFCEHCATTHMEAKRCSSCKLLICKEMFETDTQCFRCCIKTQSVTKCAMSFILIPEVES